MYSKKHFLFLKELQRIFSQKLCCRISSISHEWKNTTRTWQYSKLKKICKKVFEIFGSKHFSLLIPNQKNSHQNEQQQLKIQPSPTDFLNFISNLTQQNFEILTKSFRRRTQANHLKPTPILIILNKLSPIKFSASSTKRLSKFFRSDKSFFRSVIPSAQHN